MRPGYLKYLHSNGNSIDAAGIRNDDRLEFASLHATLSSRFLSLCFLGVACLGLSHINCLIFDELVILCTLDDRPVLL